MGNAIIGEYPGVEMIHRGGTNEERLYLYDLKFDCGDDICLVKATDMPDLKNLIARHKARYCIPALFCRPKMHVLDFPCGSGYGSQILNIFDVKYEGRDNDLPTIEYAKHFYNGCFVYDDLTNPHLADREYDVIACIEGLEHIEGKHQQRLIEYFYNALKFGGVLVVTTPEKKNGNDNPYHKQELMRNEFEDLLLWKFNDYQVLTVKDTNHKGEMTNFMYGVCRK